MKLPANGDDENNLPLLISLLYSVSRAAVTRDFDRQDFIGDDSQFLTSMVDDNDQELGSSSGTFFSLYATAGTIDRPAHYIFLIRDLSELSPPDTPPLTHLKMIHTICMRLNFMSWSTDSCFLLSSPPNR
ncbi:methyl-accepting chemotaxis sensory transducer [Striga asiatica]|uniref:Methyl-accepting chemotaxis sensory transducer n=1 Tax=Striga asiatica TaxID=4170 RepID=A0A5A7QJD1_STRAF|nr:methyl-accepting chemotaxis sensory transducer [Striga asiatica]